MITEMKRGMLSLMFHSELTIVKRIQRLRGMLNFPHVDSDTWKINILFEKLTLEIGG